MRLVLVLGLVLVLVTACSEPLKPPPVRPRTLVEPVSLFSPPTGFTTLRVLVPPVLERGSMERAYQRFDDFLSRQLGVPVELVIGESYEDVVERTTAQDFDVVILSPFTYALASKTTKLECLVQLIGEGSATAAGYLVSRDDSAIRSLGDLPGARVAFVERASTSGYIYAVKAMLDSGIDPKKHLGSYDFLGNHEAVLMAVVEGRADVGATYQGALTSLKRTHGIDPLSFRVIAKTERTPRDIICARRGLPEGVSQEIQRSLMALTMRNRAGREILGPMSVNGFQPPDDAAFDGVRATAAAVEAWERSH